MSCIFFVKEEYITNFEFIFEKYLKMHQIQYQNRIIYPINFNYKKCNICLNEAAVHYLFLKYLLSINIKNLKSISNSQYQDNIQNFVQDWLFYILLNTYFFFF